MLHHPRQNDHQRNLFGQDDAGAGRLQALGHLTYAGGETYDSDYVSRPGDTFGLNPAIRHWLIENPDHPIDQYTPPTHEEVRETLPPLTARQLRLGLINSGYTMAQVTSIIEAMPEGAGKKLR